MAELLSTFPSRKWAPTWLTIGNFDGVHLGHQALVRSVLRYARRDGAMASVLTFDPHPRRFFQSDEVDNYLMTRHEKEETLASLGVDQVITINFNQTFATMFAEDFLQLLQDHFELKGIVIGPNFGFGRGRTGGVEFVKENLESEGISVIVADPVCYEGEAISSSAIRTALLSGKPEAAKAQLGRPFSMTGKVIKGKKRGRKLGLPTANMKVQPTKLVPKFGVYATLCHLDGKVYRSVSSLGVRPTFDDTRLPNLETLILDFDDNIYKKTITVDFMNYIRPEIKFDSIPDLVGKIEEDKEIARRLLKDGSKA